ncbi:hypothetical protein [Amycolatopsis tucumanensis]|uniref:Uncharacterized protein n=1 Tax=Amycolatopsis tucumanensis TaxID=401106 RepID=A0ABP7JPA6_9PSEU|nr:hypothetical protein [Amycolatopsis tucumanensis]MCF6428887.1 hypothetical protein [Amycolatopsis tucumanensis]
MGAMWVLVPAFAEHEGAAGQSGLLVAVWSAGSLAGGVALAARPPRSAQRNTYTALLGALALTSLPLALPGSVGVMAVVIAVFGLALAPWLAVHDQLVAGVGEDRSGAVRLADDAGPDRQRRGLRGGRAGRRPLRRRPGVPPGQRGAGDRAGGGRDKAAHPAGCGRLAVSGS